MESTAAGAVFNTAELLESILLQLPTRDLLLSQRVCQTWKKAIANSSKLRQALFLEPIAVKSLCADLSYANVHCRHRLDTKDLIINPLLSAVQLTSSEEDKKRPHAKWSRPEASYRKMFVSQPALQNVRAWFEVTGAVFDAEIRDLYDPEGIRGDQLYYNPSKWPAHWPVDGGRNVMNVLVWRRNSVLWCLNANAAAFEELRKSLKEKPAKDNVASIADDGPASTELVWWDDDDDPFTWL